MTDYTNYKRSLQTKFINHMNTLAIRPSDTKTILSERVDKIRAICLSLDLFPSDYKYYHDIEAELKLLREQKFWIKIDDSIDNFIEETTYKPIEEE